MKTFAFFFRAGGLLSLLLALSFAPAAKAIVLAPGEHKAAAYEAEPTGGSVLTTLSSPFTSTSFAGTLVSSVIAGDTSNPLGGYTFTYRIFLTSGPQEASQFTVSSFASFTPFLTDVSYSTPSSFVGTIVNPSDVSRSADGQVVRFSFFAPGIVSGESSALLVVQTDALGWASGVSALIDGQSVNVASLAVPEPGAFALLLAGLGMLALRRK